MPHPSPAALAHTRLVQALVGIDGKGNARWQAMAALDDASAL